MAVHLQTRDMSASQMPLGPRVHGAGMWTRAGNDVKCLFDKKSPGAARAAICLIFLFCLIFADVLFVTHVGTFILAAFELSFFGHSLTPVCINVFGGALPDIFDPRMHRFR